MPPYTISSAMRVFFLFAASVLWLGIWLTGFSVVSWVLYVPPSFFSFAAVTGICPGLILARLVFPEKR
ncbi:MAG: hypothetical protein ACYCP0_07195 [Acidiferrobacteraceae bacterium]